jgi:hypothetical protein
MTQLPIVDGPPRNGRFIEHYELGLTPKEVADGNALGESIDLDNDEDAGDV